MIIDFWNRNGGSPTPTPTDLSGVVASADLSGTTLNLDNPSGTTIDTVDFSGIIPAPVETSGFVHNADFVVSSSTLNLENTSGTTIDTIDLSSLKQDLTNYYTKAELDTTEETISRALNDLNTRLSSTITSSQGITNIWKGTQAEYDQLTPDNNTIYIIITT